jgi:hypothetical protein
VWKLHGKHGGPKKLIGDQAQVFPMFPTRPPRHFWYKERKSPNPTCFECWIQTAGQSQVVTAATTSYRLRLGVLGLHGKLIKSTFIWIWTHVHIFFEAAAISDLLQRPFLSTVLRHLILARWGVYQVEPNRGAS